ncbi:unnamed protein product [Caenorhabditis auriculariae]|uniref:Serpentine receptor class gamma n=1 Tax=Caenorhabditis auriculariae TaxID=2777116 RepID=A0A8S1HAY1_9PELO|nr:unnamed protein product [Caenorhabditis auriculariae]
MTSSPSVDDHLKNLAAASNGTECDDPTYVVSKYIQFFVPIFYGIPTVVLYFHIVFAVATCSKKSTLNIAFYKIYSIMAVVTCVMWVWDMTTTRFIATGIWCHEMLAAYGTPSHFYAPLQFVMTYSRHAQFYSATVLSLNRMTAVVWPVKYNKIWEGPWKLPQTAAIIFILPIPSTWYLGPWTRALLARYPMGGLTLTYEKLLQNPWNSVTWMTMFVGSLCGIVILVSTLVTYINLRNLMRKAEKGKSKTDVNLLIVGMVSSITTLFLAAVEAPFYIFCNYFMNNYYFFICTNIKQVLIDIILVFSPWSMIVVCTSVRQEIMKIYGYKVPSAVTVVEPTRFNGKIAPSPSHYSRNSTLSIT